MFSIALMFLASPKSAILTLKFKESFSIGLSISKLTVSLGRLLEGFEVPVHDASLTLVEEYHSLGDVHHHLPPLLPADRDVPPLVQDLEERASEAELRYEVKVVLELGDSDQRDDVRVWS